MIFVNIDKAKAIAHDKRRAARSDEFALLDVKAAIPAEAVAAETARQAVRAKYADIQTEIDAVSDIASLTRIVAALQKPT